MKRLLAFIIALLALAAASCKGTETEKTQSGDSRLSVATEQPNYDKDQLTYEEILALPRLPDYEELRRIMWKLDDAYSEFGNHAAVVCGETLSVKYYYGWSQDSTLKGLTVVEVRVNEVSADYNSAKVKQGDVLLLRQESYIRFKNRYDVYAFFSEKHNATIESLDAFRAHNPAKNGFFQLIPQRGEEYEYFIFQNDFPMKSGEKYTMLCWIEDGVTAEGMPCSYCFYVRPEDGSIDLAEFANEHEFIYADDCIAIADEIAALFK